MSSAASIVSK
uniref:Uncharacterized protein n=1 Tax=Lepeophtheirus salmonis TaxID=72036 RepID=A0A0K2T3T3_LEPSM